MRRFSILISSYHHLVLGYAKAGDDIRFYLAGGAFGTEKFTQLMDVLFLLCGEAQAVTGTGDGVDGFPGAAGIVIFLAHITGNKAVGFSMEENYG